MICFELFIDGRCVGNRSCARRLFGRRSTEAVIFHAFNRVTRAAFIISPSVLSTAAERRLRSAQMLTETRKSTPRERNRILLDRVGQKMPRLPLVSQAEVPRWWKSLPWERCVWPTPAAIKRRLDLQTWMLGTLEGVAVLQKPTDSFQITGSAIADTRSRCETHRFFVTLCDSPPPPYC